MAKWLHSFTFSDLIYGWNCTLYVSIEALRGCVTCQDLIGLKCQTWDLNPDLWSLKPMVLTTGWSWNLLLLFFLENMRMIHLWFWSVTLWALRPLMFLLSSWALTTGGSLWITSSSLPVISFHGHISQPLLKWPNIHELVRASVLPSECVGLSLRIPWKKLWRKSWVILLQPDFNSSAMVEVFKLHGKGFQASFFLKSGNFSLNEILCRTPIWKTHERTILAEEVGVAGSSSPCLPLSAPTNLSPTPRCVGRHLGSAR